MLKTSNIYIDAEGNARDKATDEVVFHVDDEVREDLFVGEKMQRRLAKTCLPKDSRNLPNVVGRISPKLIAESVEKAKRAAAKKRAK